MIRGVRLAGTSTEIPGGCWRVNRIVSDSDRVFTTSVFGAVLQHESEHPVRDLEGRSLLFGRFSALDGRGRVPAPCIANKKSSFQFGNDPLFRKRNRCRSRHQDGRNENLHARYSYGGARRASMVLAWLSVSLTASLASPSHDCFEQHRGRPVRTVRNPKTAGAGVQRQRGGPRRELFRANER